MNAAEKARIPAIFAPLLDRIGGTTLWCFADDDPRAEIPADLIPACALADLPALLLDPNRIPDVLVVTGYPARHHINVVREALSAATAACRRSTVVVTIQPPRALAAEATLEGVTAALRRSRSELAALRAATEELAGLDGTERLVLWAPALDGGGISISEEASERIAGLLPTYKACLERIDSATSDATDRTLDALAIVEEFRRAQLSGERLVRSTRFRVGTRIVRAGRRLKGATKTFRSPREILARSSNLEAWEQRLGELRPPAPKPPEPDAFRIRVVLPELRIAGGAIAIAELVDEMRLLGADARIETLRVRADALRLPLVTAPRVHRSVDALITELEQCDVAIATHWTTAEWVNKSVRAGRAKRSAGYFQDYEPWFFPADDLAGRERVRATYSLVDDRLVTSRWLADLLAGDGYASTIMPSGIDLSIFTPRPTEPELPPTVVTMARPRTPRRGFATLVDTLARVHRARPDVRFALFGERLGAMPLPFPCDRYGVINDRVALASLLASAWVHYDASDFQGFGCTALEAMACGTPSVLSEVGGAHEFATNGKNVIFVSPHDPDAHAAAILQFISDQEFRRNASAAGLAVVPEFSVRRRARALLDHLADHG